MSVVDPVRRAAVTVGPDAHASPVGLKLDEHLGYERWSQIGEQLGALAGASSWWVGDWINYGFWEYGKTYEAARDLTGLAYQTLANIASVCEAFDVSRRRENLSFGHHEVVAALDVQAQDEWLDRAEAEGLSVMALRAAVAATRELPASDVPVTVERIRFTVSAERAQRWQSAAERAGLDLSEWAATVLDEAAA